MDMNTEVWNKARILWEVVAAFVLLNLLSFIFCGVVWLINLSPYPLAYWFKEGFSPLGVHINAHAGMLAAGSGIIFLVSVYLFKRAHARWPLPGFKG